VTKKLCKRWTIAVGSLPHISS